MNLAIQELERGPKVDPARIQSFLSDHTFPLVEGDHVTLCTKDARTPCT